MATRCIRQVIALVVVGAALLAGCGELPNDSLPNSSDAKLAPPDPRFAYPYPCSYAPPLGSCGPVAAAPVYATPKPTASRKGRRLG